MGQRQGRGQSENSQLAQDRRCPGLQVLPGLWLGWVPSGAGPRVTWPRWEEFPERLLQRDGRRKEEKALAAPLTMDVHVQLMNISVAIYLSLHHPAAGATDPRWINIATGRSMRHPLPPPATSIRTLVPTTCWRGTLSCSIGFRFSLAVEAQSCSNPGRPPHPSRPSPFRLGTEPEAAVSLEGPFGKPSPPE